MNLKNVSDGDLLIQTRKTCEREKQATLELLEHLLEVDARGLHFRQGYGSIWEYVFKDLKYSEAGASERVSAMRLLKRAPEARAMIQSQELSLSVAAKVQYFVRAVEKSERRVLAADETKSLLKQCAGKSKREVEKIFVKMAPAAALPRERVREVSETHTELRLVLDLEFMHLLQEAKVLLGAQDQTEAITRALKIVVEQKKKRLNTRVNPAKLTQPSEVSAGRYIPIQIRRTLWTRAKARCEFTGDAGRCSSNHKLQIDHITPLACGGLTELSNREFSA